MIITYESCDDFKELVQVPTLFQALDFAAKIDRNNPRKRQLNQNAKSVEELMPEFYQKCETRKSKSQKKAEQVDGKKC